MSSDTFFVWKCVCVAGFFKMNDSGRGRKSGLILVAISLATRRRIVKPKLIFGKYIRKGSTYVGNL